mgnify:CR=1 FL=1
MITAETVSIACRGRAVHQFAVARVCIVLIFGNQFTVFLVAGEHLIVSEPAKMTASTISCGSSRREVRPVLTVASVVTCSHWRTTVPEFKAVNEEIDKLWAQHPEGETVLNLAQRLPEDARQTFLLDDSRPPDNFVGVYAMTSWNHTSTGAGKQGDMVVCPGTGWEIGADGQLGWRVMSFSCTGGTLTDTFVAELANAASAQSSTTLFEVVKLTTPSFAVKPSPCQSVKRLPE